MTDQQNIAPQNCPDKQTKSRHSGSITAATYIVGCLAAWGSIDLDLDNSEDQGRFWDAIRIVSNCIEDMGMWKRGADMPDLGFLWE